MLRDGRVYPCRAKSVSVFLVVLSVLSVQVFGQVPQLAFTASIDGNWELFCWGGRTSPLLRMTETGYDENEPRWSKDRKKIVFSASDGKLYLVDVATKDVTELAAEDAAQKKTSPCFSPDGKNVVYVRFKGGPADDTELVVYHIETKRVRTLIDQPGGQFFPNWSPDGEYIVYTNVHGTDGCGRIIQELWIVHKSEAYARQLLMTNANCMNPVWSPDGKRIAFSSDRGGNFDIWVLSLDNWELEQITTDSHLDTSPAWSPDGQRIGFVSARMGKRQIWTKELGNGILRLLTPLADNGAECRDIAW